MTNAIPPELEQKILEQLKDSVNPSDIILGLCESVNINWSEAESVVTRLQSGNKDEIILAQSPIIVLIALATFFGGTTLIGIAIFDIVATYQSYGIVGPQGIGFLAYLFTYGGFFWELALLGMAMLIGSLRGMQDVWAAIFDKLGIFQSQ